MSELIHYGVPGMKWGQRKEYEPHPRKAARMQKKEQKAQIKADKKAARKRKLKKAGIILGASAAVTIGALVTSKLIRDKNMRDFKSLEEKVRTLNAEGEMDQFVRGIPKAKSEDIFKLQQATVTQTWNKKISDIKADVANSQYSSKRLSELRKWNKNYTNAQSFLRGIGVT